MELYLEELPRSFYGKTFAECALLVVVDLFLKTFHYDSLVSVLNWGWCYWLLKWNELMMMEMVEWLLISFHVIHVWFFREVVHLWFACQVKMPIGLFDWNILLINDWLFDRVKHYCSICYPVLDKLTESQLKNMRKCSHSE